MSKKMASKDNLRQQSSFRDADSDLYSVQDNTGGSSNVPAFLMKLWTLVEDPSTDEIICWDPSGKTFHIFDQSRFAHDVLPFYFKHNNISSFIRQLNMYGFRKQTHPEQGGLKVERDDLEFGHVYFQRGQEQLLDMIKRKAAPVKVENRTSHVLTDEVHKVLSDVTQLRGKQENITSSLEQLKRENEALWREVASLRQKHSKQQQIVNKLIQFLLSLVGRRMPGLKRKMPLMISNTPAAQNSGVSPAKSARIMSDRSADHTYTVESPSALSEMQLSPSIPSSSGLVIHELSDPFDVDDNRRKTLTTPSVPVSVSNTQLLTTTEGVGNSIAAQQPVTTVNLLDQALTSANIVPEPSVANNGVASSVALASLQPQLSLLSQPVLQQETLIPQQPTLLPQQPKQQQQQQQQPQVALPASVPSNQVALRTQDMPLSSTPKSLTTPKEVNDQLDILQSDLDGLKEVLSMGQYNIDSSFLMGLFDPEHSLPVNLDSSFLESLVSDSGDANSLSTSENIAGNEVLQYQPPDILPDLFDLGVVNSPPPEDDDELPVYFSGKEPGLQTPQAVPSKGDLAAKDSGSSLSINAEDLD